MKKRKKKGGKVLNLIKQNDVMQILHFFSVVEDEPINKKM